MSPVWLTLSLTTVLSRNRIIEALVSRSTDSQIPLAPMVRTFEGFSELSRLSFDDIEDDRVSSRFVMAGLSLKSAE